MDNKTDHELKRKAWLAVFLISAAFWLAVGLILFRFLAKHNA
ncbi:YmiA family putative membrane protein [Sodalis ligni]|nr:YmiA family putative membrane protein [Sodalis ligni]QWA09887.1 YmiA family putative membrane protein [Sodalis ligni]